MEKILRVIKLVKYKFGRLGPGFITGAADDDPSGIATYSIVGAKFGYGLNWLALISLPMMITIQEMCGRIGMVSGMGLAGAIKKFYSKKLLLLATILLMFANVVNIGADLGAMAASLQMVIGLPFIFWLSIVTILTIVMEIFVPYDRYSRYLKWMGLSLLVYSLTAILTNQNWIEVFIKTIIPTISLDMNYLMAIVGFIGTSISPYLFFWQAAEEVEESIKEGKIQEFEETPEVVEGEIHHMRKDTAAGMFFSQLIAYFIMLTTASTLHTNGITDIETPQQAALALRPLAGNFAYLLFAFGIVGIGLQSVPILAGSVAYSIAESFGFKEGLAKKLTEAKAFYLVIGLSTLIGALMNLLGINPIQALFYTAIINGIVAVPLIAIIIRIANDERIVGKYRSGKWGNIIGWITFAFMGSAVTTMFVSILRTR
ncbi:Nramp family divalent metal transporter [Candidatus Roizmanbacteria bacterium]|nr:Nramp family divalent metal transporter [Candidatus Roizmanbacteria bacterium]